MNYVQVLSIIPMGVLAVTSGYLIKNRKKLYLKNDVSKNSDKIDIIFYMEDNNFYGFNISSKIQDNDNKINDVYTGVTTLVMNTISSLNKLTEDNVQCDLDKKSKYVECILPDMKTGKGSSEAKILLQAFKDGILGMNKTYGREFININENII